MLWNDLRYRLRSLFRRSAAEREMAAELAHHAAARGLPEADAVAEACRDARGVGAIETVARDLRHAARGLRKGPSFAVPAVLTLALGLGSAVAIYSVADTLALHPLAYPAAHRLVTFRLRLGARGREVRPLSPSDVAMLRPDGKVVADWAATMSVVQPLSGAGPAQSAKVLRATSGLFPTLGVAAALGRTFTAAEEAPGHNVVVLSDALWRASLHADTGVLGRTVDLNGEPFTIIGVMPRGFQYPPPGSFVEPADVFVPAAITAKEAAMPGQEFDWTPIGRLAPGASLEAAQAQVDHLVAGIRRSWIAKGVVPANFQLSSHAARLDAMVAAGSASLLRLLLGAAALLLLLSVANAANMLLVRSGSRRREWSVRSALGASRGRILGQALTESGLLALAAAAVGTGFAWMCVRALAALAPPTLPQLAALTISPAVLAFALLLALVSGPLVGVLSARSAAATGLSGAARGFGLAAPGGGARLPLHWRRTLVVVQVAIAFVLTCGAGLMVRGLMIASDGGAGVATAGRMTATLKLSATEYRTPQQVVALLDGLSGPQGLGLPDATWAASSALPPYFNRGRSFSIRGREVPKTDGNRPLVNYAMVRGPFFQAMGIPLLQGRAFSSADETGRDRVAIISASMAKRYWPDGGALGREVSVSGIWLTVVGVVGDVKARGMDADAGLQFYEPFLQGCTSKYVFACTGPHIVVRSQAAPAVAAAALRSTMRRLNPDVPVTGVRSLDAVLYASLTPRRFNTDLIAFFGVTALLLAAVGLYGVLGFMISERRQEIGIRMALGAAPGRVLGDFLRQGIAWTVAGLGLGAVGAYFSAGVIVGLLYDTPPLDPRTWIATAALLLAVAAAACFLPAVRASRTDPQAVLRQG